MSNKIKKTFDQIYADDEIKLRTNKYILQIMDRKMKKPTFKKKYLIAFSTSMLCCTLLYYFYFIPVTVISIDVNPSIQLELNFLDRVISAHGYNIGGEYVIENNDIKHMDYIDALNNLVESKSMATYFTEDAIMEIMVVTDSEYKKKDMEVKLVNAQSLSNINAVCHTANRQLKHQANKVGLSCGKFNAYLNLKEVDPSVTPEDMNQLSMKQIKERLNVRLEKNRNEDYQHKK